MIGQRIFTTYWSTERPLVSVIGLGNWSLWPHGPTHSFIYRRRNIASEISPLVVLERNFRSRQRHDDHPSSFGQLTTARFQSSSGTFPPTRRSAYPVGRRQPSCILPSTSSLLSQCHSKQCTTLVNQDLLYNPHRVVLGQCLPRDPEAADRNL